MQHLISAKSLSERLCVTEGTLAKWRLYGTGPRFIRAGRRVAYDPADVESWVDKRRLTFTGEVR